MLVVLLVLVITGIMGLDRPRRGLVNVAQTSMIRLQSSLLRMSFEGGPHLIGADAALAPPGRPAAERSHPRGLPLPER